MTLVEAEDIYKELYGDEGYAMWHEIGDKAYKNYKLLNISDADKAKWDRDILEDNFEIFSIDPDRAWHAIRVILDVFSRGYISPEGYALRLLDEMVKLENPSDSNRIDIIHVMGETTQFHDSGIKIYFEKTIYGKKMNEIVRKLMDYDCPDEPIYPNSSRSRSKKELFKEACDLYEKDYELYSY